MLLAISTQWNRIFNTNTAASNVDHGFWSIKLRWASFRSYLWQETMGRLRSLFIAQAPIFQELASGSFGSSHFFKKFVGGKKFVAPMFQFEPESTKDWKKWIFNPRPKKNIGTRENGKKHKFWKTFGIGENWPSFLSLVGIINGRLTYWLRLQHCSRLQHSIPDNS